MTFNDTPYGSGSPRVIGSPVVPERPALSAQAIVDRSGAANLIVLLRVRMGFPAESFALAARPLIDGYAKFVQLRPIPDSSRYGGPGGQLQRGLVTALRALDHRRGQILPRNAPPEILGALAHRWTYAVFAAALLRDAGRAQSDDSMRMFERWVPPIVQAWLAEHPPLMAELRAVLVGRADASSAIAELVERAATGARPRIEATVPHTQTESFAGAVESSVETPPIAPETDRPEFLDGVDAADAGRPRRFLDWVRQGIADGTLLVNVRGALVHGVEDGLLLASPGIFRAFLRRDGPGQAEPGDAAKRLQREVLRAGWHLRADGGVNLHGYAWKQDGRAADRIHGIVILSPGRFFDPMPAINPALVRVGDSAAAAE
ncbi:MAG: TraI domain-containing protein [Burkholderiaceae bacterium]|nr:TraI domain-containing protein [Burkholderiaceae bacterium]